MLCPQCGRYNDDDKVVCDYCGTPLERELPDTGEEEELMRFRQGRHLRQAEQPEAEEAPVRRRRSASRAFEDPMPPETPESTGEIYGRRESLQNTGRLYGDDLRELVRGDDLLAQERVAARSAGVQEGMVGQFQRRSRLQKHLSYRRMVNWAHVAIAAFVLLVAGVITFALVLRNTAWGQVQLARWGKDASAAAMWQVGDECFQRGEVDRAIGYFTTAREKNLEAREPNPDGLLMLGEAYEAKGELLLAEEVYAYIYTEVEPAKTEAYTAQVRVLRELGRDAEAAVLLQTAYEKTRSLSFRTARDEILPSIPTVDVAEDYYTDDLDVRLRQQEEYSVYYTLNPLAILPQDGILYEGPIHLGEGEHELRAVAVYGDLVSDPMKATYQIYYPSPLQPEANLAPGTYESARKNVRLWKKELSKEELEKNPGYAATLEDERAQTVTIYYTIDGSIPDADSPIFREGEPIVMDTNGYMTLRAVAVNGYGKQGNLKEVEIKLNLRTRTPGVYCTEDVIGSLRLGSTTQESFLRTYGEGQKKENTVLPGVAGECVRYTYPWGTATFLKSKAGWHLAELYMTTNEFSLPRSTSIGMTETEITGKFKDYGQVTSPSGNRGLYRDIKNSDWGKIWVQEDGGKIIRYRTDTPDLHVWQLEYILNAAGRCTAVRWLYEP